MNQSQRIGPWIISMYNAEDGIHVDSLYNGKLDEAFSQVFHLYEDDTAQMYYEKVIQRCQLEVSLKL